MADLSRITLPSGTTYDIKDAQARQDIDALRQAAVGGMHFIGITTTILSDGDTTSTITIDGSNITLDTTDAGSLAIYGEYEFVWTGSKWQEFGSTGSLKSLAFKDTATTSYQPAGTVSAPTFTGGELTSTGTYTPQGSVEISVGTGTANYTPSGTVSAPTLTVTPNTATVNSITAVGTLPSLSCTVADENLTIAFDAGTLPTKGSNTTVCTGIQTATASAPTFTGTGANLTASFTGTSGDLSVSGTPSGTISQPTFNGTTATITVS
mgnify:CR=1 FL=1